MRQAPTAAFVWVFAVYSYLATTVCAAWFGRRFAAARGETLSVPESLLWQGAVYAAWLPAAGLVWLILRRFGSGPRGLAALAAAMLAVAPLEALASGWIDLSIVGAGDPWSRALGRTPVCILLYTAIVAVGLAAAHHRRAAEARARTAILEAALAEARQALARAPELLAAPPPERLMVMAGSRRVPVALDAVEWFSAADNYVVVHWADSEGAERKPHREARGRQVDPLLAGPRQPARAHAALEAQRAHARPSGAARGRERAREEVVGQVRGIRHLMLQRGDRPREGTHSGLARRHPAKIFRARLQSAPCNIRFMRTA